MRGETVRAMLSSQTMQCKNARTVWGPTNGKTVVAFLDVFPSFSTSSYPLSDLKTVFDTSVSIAENIHIFLTVFVWQCQMNLLFR